MSRRKEAILAREILVEMFYDTAINEELWPTVLAELGKFVNCDYVHVALYDRAHEQQVLRIMAASQLAPLDDLEIIEFEERASRPFRHEFIANSGLTYQVFSPLIARDEFFTVVVAGNSRHRGEISEQQKDKLNRILPHLQRAMRLHIKMHVMKRRLSMADNALDRISLGVVVVADDGRIVDINVTGSAILREADGLCGQHDRLVIGDKEGAHVLRRFTAANRCAAADGRSCVKRFLVRRPSGRSAYHVFVDHPPAQSSVWSRNGRAELLLFVCDPDRVPKKLGAGLVELYGLTGGEARLAAAIANGKTLSEYAEEKGVSVHTVRFQMQQALRKADVTRQSDLVRMIGKTFAQIEAD